MKFPKRLTDAHIEFLDQLDSMKLPSVFDQAACRTASPILFDSLQADQTELAKRVCSACPIVADCLVWAIENAEVGVWGGTTDSERKEMPGFFVKSDADGLAEKRAKRNRLNADVAIQALAEEFGVTERTIHRWRVRIQKEAS